MWIEYNADRLRVYSRLSGTSGLLHLKYVQWILSIFLIHIVRQFAGFDWMPTAIAFESSHVPSPATRSCWPNVQFLSGQHAAWISLPITLLGRPNRSTTSFAPPRDNQDYDIVELLKLMLPAYLDEGNTALVDVAEMRAAAVEWRVRLVFRLCVAQGHVGEGHLSAAPVPA